MAKRKRKTPRKRSNEPKERWISKGFDPCGCPSDTGVHQFFIDLGKGARWKSVPLKLKP